MLYEQEIETQRLFSVAVVEYWEQGVAGTSLSESETIASSEMVGRTSLRQIVGSVF